ncbi:hypothetical protein WMY93_029515 [Mugilogobius chulae]|uniref:G-protein coupled receptors family 1 profile domain-containing protein n=1 Tax=Mugilogobius chulae TaxID=88201 RepID=A0AAW0MVS5_9GOBI
MFANGTRRDHFTLLCFPGLHPQYYAPASALMCLVYIAIGVGNMFILIFVMYEKKIQKPRYLIFCHLALNDLTFGTVTLPKIIAKYWFGDSLISFYGCFIQMYFVHYLGSVQSFNLMSCRSGDQCGRACLPPSLTHTTEAIMHHTTNTTTIDHFYITGFPGLSAQYFAPVSLVLFLVYLAIVIGNIFILAFVRYERAAHSYILMVMAIDRFVAILRRYVTRARSRTRRQLFCAECCGSSRCPGWFLS